MKVTIDSLHRDQKEELFNLHAMFVDHDAVQASFNRKEVPVVTIDLRGVDRQLLYPLTSDQVNQYDSLLSNKDTQYPIVSGDKLIDGLHRISAAILKGKTELEVLDLGSLLKPEDSGFMFTVTLKKVLSPSLTI